MSHQEKAQAVMGFVNSIIDAHETGHMDESSLTLADLYAMARHHCHDSLGVQVPDIFAEWGHETAKRLLMANDPANQ